MERIRKKESIEFDEEKIVFFFKRKGKVEVIYDNRNVCVYVYVYIHLHVK